MNFTVNKDITFNQAVELMFDKLGVCKIMALATAFNDVPMVRNVSCLIYDEAIWFKTDMNFRKTAQMLRNPKVAMCWNGVQVEALPKTEASLSTSPAAALRSSMKSTFGAATTSTPTRTPKFSSMSSPSS